MERARYSRRFQKYLWVRKIDRPVVNADTAEPDADTPIIADVSDNCTDPNGDPLDILSPTPPDGKVTINADGTLDFTPNSNFSGPTTTAYSVKDGYGVGGYRGWAGSDKR